MAISFHNNDCTYTLKDKRKVASWVKDTIKKEGCSIGDISFIFCSPESHIEINRKYLNHDYHTDVITFDYSDIEVTKIISGDIFIDPITVRENAVLFNSHPAIEMLRVIIHGVLHLCGYKDSTDNEQKSMRRLEDLYLDNIRDIISI